jgi:hypothetical protein
MLGSHQIQQASETVQSYEMLGFAAGGPLSTIAAPALLNIEPLGTIICGGHTQDRSAISRFFPHQIPAQVVQYLASLRYAFVRCSNVPPFEPCIFRATGTVVDMFWSTVGVHVCTCCEG